MFHVTRGKKYQGGHKYLWLFDPTDDTLVTLVLRVPILLVSSGHHSDQMSQQALSLDSTDS